jgi:hypothetical protein
MSDMAKKAREAMKAKASKLTSADPHQKVDSSTWTPPEALNADVKTGLRPISRRAFKKGGKVMGQKPKANLGKATRGGNKPLTPDNFANKDVKAANEERAGIKHVGALKTGGRAKKNNGGGTDEIAEMIERSNTERSPSASAAGMGNMPLPVPRPKNLGKPERFKSKYDLNTQSEKRGGKVKKATGGAMSGAQAMMKKAQQTAGVPASTLDSVPATSRLSKAAGLKKGGTAKHDDVKQDMALIKKMVKPEARKGKAIGGAFGEFLSPALMLANAVRGDDKKRGGRAARKEGGGVFSGPGYPGKVPGVTGGRIARATGGKTKGKGKTNINIIVAAGKPADGQDMMNPMGGPTRPPGVPVAVPPPQGAAPMPAGMPMPMPMPPAPGPAAGPMPMPRKSGGRLTAKASSYKDMTAGSGGGEGRLQKTDIAEKHKDAPAFKKGGKVYRSYKDMDAGSGSGMGRLEKTEIQSHKR